MDSILSTACHSVYMRMLLRQNHINEGRLVLAVSHSSCPSQTRTTCPQTFETKVHRCPFTMTKVLESLMSWMIQHNTPKFHWTILIIPILRRHMPVRQTKRRMRPCMMRNIRCVELEKDTQAFLLCRRTLQARLQECRLVCVIYPSIFCPHARAFPADHRTYAPSPPFEEAGPTSCIWRAYLDESLVYNTDMIGNQRGTSEYPPRFCEPIQVKP